MTSPYYERLGPHRVIEERLHGQPFIVLVQPARPGSAYGCSPSDVLHVLSHLPASDVLGLELLVMRQPTTAQEQKHPVWGRCLFDARFGAHRGPAIMLESVDLLRPMLWPHGLTRADRAEFDKLLADGHRAVRGQYGVSLRPSEEAVRNTVLYRTLLHEIGHWTDWQERVLHVASEPGGAKRKRLETAYFARPDHEREAVAHHYATRQVERLRSRGVIPFESTI